MTSPLLFVIIPNEKKKVLQILQMPLLLDLTIDFKAFEHAGSVTVSLAARRVQLFGACANLVHPSIAQELEKVITPVAARANWDERGTAAALQHIQFEVLCPGTCTSTIFAARSTKRVSSYDAAVGAVFTVCACSVVPASLPDELVSQVRQLQRRIKNAADFKLEGVTLFSQKDFRSAIGAFRSSLRELEAGLLPTIVFSEDDVRRAAGSTLRSGYEMAAACLSNMALCVLQLGEASSKDLHQAVRYCDRGERLTTRASEHEGQASEELSKLRVKLIFRKAKLQRRLCDYTGAMSTLRGLEALGVLDKQSAEDVRRERRCIDDEMKPAPRIK